MRMRQVGFTITTKAGQAITLLVDRCGSDSGGNSIAIVSKDGKVLSCAPQVP